MATKKNGWRRITIVAGAITAIGAAGLVLEPYVNFPWAPPIAYVWAGENILSRLDTQLLTYEDLLQRARDRKDPKAVLRLQKNVIETRRKIDGILLHLKAKKK